MHQNPNLLLPWMCKCNKPCRWIINNAILAGVGLCPVGIYLCLLWFCSLGLWMPVPRLLAHNWQMSYLGYVLHSELSTTKLRHLASQLPWIIIKLYRTYQEAFRIYFFWPIPTCLVRSKYKWGYDQKPFKPMGTLLSTNKGLSRPTKIPRLSSLSYPWQLDSLKYL